MTKALDDITGVKTVTPGLLRILGISFGLAVIVGSTLGIGILRTPGLVAAQLGDRSAILTVWVVGGLYTLIGSVCLTELGAMLPRAGGYYVYARRAFGDTVGFAVGWTDWLTYCAVLGYVSIGMSEFVALLVPSLGAAVTPIAVALLLCFVALQWMGVRVSSRFQEIATALKFVAFLALVAACFAASPALAPASGNGAALPSAPSLVGVVVALQSVVITYGGWQSALYFTEEDRDPARNLPRSMIGGEILVIGIYLLVNLALLSVLTVASLARSTLPAADAAQVILGARGAQTITVLSLISLPPLLNAIMMIGTRILFAMGRDGLLWSRTAAINAGGTPGHRDPRDDGGGDRLDRDRDVPEAGGHGVVLPGGELRGVLSGARRPAPARAWPCAAVSRVGLSVVRGHRPGRRCRVPDRRAGRRHGQRPGGAWTAGGRADRPAPRT